MVCPTAFDLETSLMSWPRLDYGCCATGKEHRQATSKYISGKIIIIFIIINRSGSRSVAQDVGCHSV